MNNYIYNLDRFDGLTKLINEFNIKTMLEIGVLEGVCADHILNHTSIEKIVGVDIKILEKAKAKQRRWGERWVLIESDSRTAHNLLPIKEFDMVYLDGGHSYDGVKSDLQIYYPMVKDGGILSGDDYEYITFDNEECGVVQAVNEFAQKIGKIPFINNIHSTSIRDNEIWCEKKRELRKNTTGLQGTYFYWVK